jgi:histidine ammonia-lyase
MAVAATALTMEVVRADTAALTAQPTGARSEAAESVASDLLEHLVGSTMVAEGRRPDPFSVRCAPAVIGTAQSAISSAAAIIRTDLNAANVNPLVRVDVQRVDEVGNFHGAEVAFAMDALKVALTTLASMSERRTFRLTYGQLSGLPSFLVRGTGLNSGLMIAQYTAALTAQPTGARSEAAESVASDLLEHLVGSTMVAEGRRPDPFSVRCAPAVIGTAQSAISSAAAVIRTDLNAANVNPLVRVDAQRVDEVGNFHGAEVAFAMDALKVALTTLASMSERRTFRLTYGQLSGLPSFLVRGTGLNSGLMIAQYTAASLVSECKVLSHPASVDAIPTVQHQEDHVSMAPIAARGALRVLAALSEVLSIELICGAQGLDFRLEGTAVEDDGVVHAVPPLKAGKGTMASYRFVRGVLPRWVEDRALMPDLHAMAEAVRACGPSEQVATALPW